MSHWSQDDTPADTSWQDAGWAAVQNHLAAEEAPDTISGDDLRETAYEGVYADANDKLWSIQDGEGGQVAVPTTTSELEREALEHTTVEMYLTAHGVNFETASHDEMLDACAKTDAYLARAYENIGVEHDVEQASLADEVALAQRLDQFIADTGSTPEEAAPYLTLAFEALEDGNVDLEGALKHAGDAIGKWHGEVNTAAREDHFASKGYAGGLTAAFANRRAESATPAHRVNAAPQKPVTKAAGYQNLGSVDASRDQVSNALSSFMQKQREKQAVRDLAKQHVRNR